MDFLVSNTLCLEDLRAQGRWKLIRKPIVRRLLKRIKDFLKEKKTLLLFGVVKQ